ncbi:hypothetical protein AXF42_Ash014492 [Apostasia shenzhenica]|uniref:Cystatin domain-containing protein n=1 Tax=Apostasia shenzhenica TaxID=1088818 RepID=A0A2H9ZWN4_9ASPA|nr:hypothetical protein AXF42_Ash014492 [Apostasia shenzhenica]
MASVGRFLLPLAALLLLLLLRSSAIQMINSPESGIQPMISWRQASIHMGTYVMRKAVAIFNAENGDSVPKITYAVQLLNSFWLEEGDHTSRFYVKFVAVQARFGLVLARFYLTVIGKDNNEPVHHTLTPILPFTPINEHNIAI